MFFFSVLSAMPARNYTTSDAHLTQPIGDPELWLGNLLNLLWAHTRSDLPQQQTTRGDLDESILGHDVVNAPFSGKWERTLAQNLGRALFIGVFHRDEQSFSAHRPIHCPPHPL